jgi:hypothetical protein
MCANMTAHVKNSTQRHNYWRLMSEALLVYGAHTQHQQQSVHASLTISGLFHS